MNQKRLLTLIPLLFFIIISSLLGFLYISYKVETKGCLGFHKFNDEGVGIKFEIACEWEQSLKTDLAKDNYKITLTKNSTSIEIDALKINPDLGEVELSKTEYEIVEVNDSLIRFRDKDASAYYYADLFNCKADQNKKCTNYLLSNFSKISQVRLKVQPNGESISKLDKKVEDILEQ